jgi:hypothetical protein
VADECGAVDVGRVVEIGTPKSNRDDMSILEAAYDLGLITMHS